MNYTQVTMKCWAMINHSVSKEMLEVAYKYYELYRNLLQRRNVKREDVERIDHTILKAYERKKQAL